MKPQDTGLVVVYDIRAGNAAGHTGIHTTPGVGEKCREKRRKFTTKYVHFGTVVAGQTAA